jgi:hypothetical protein
MRSMIMVACLAALAGCEPPSPTYTLYRNSNLDPASRIHFATFDADDKGAGADTGDFNRGNCEMVVDLLRENLRKLNDGKEPVRFWCEMGTYRE